MVAMNTRTIVKLVWLIAFSALAFGAVIPALTMAAPGVWNPSWYRVTVDNSSSDVGRHSSIAINPTNNRPYVSYYDSANGKLKLAVYGLSSPPNCQNLWFCVNLEGDGTSQAGYDNSMVIDGSGNAWIAYTDPSLGQLTLLMVDPKGVRYPVLIDDGMDQVKYPSVAMIGNEPKVANWVYCKVCDWSRLYLDNAQYHTYLDVETVKGGSQPSQVGYFASLDYDSVSGKAMLGYRGDGNAIAPAPHTLNYAVQTYPYVGADGCHSGDYQVDFGNCIVIDPVADTGNYVSFHARHSNTDWLQVAYFNSAKHTLKYARFTGGNTFCGAGGQMGWQCDEIETIGGGGGVAMAVDAGGTPTIAYYDMDDYANGVLKAARLVGSGGNCGLGSAAGKWACDVVDRGSYVSGFHHVGLYPSIAIKPDGRAYISYYDVTAKTLQVADQQGPAPSMYVAFNPASIAVGGQSQMEFAILNNLPASQTLTNVSFSVYLGPELSVVPNGLVGSACGGSIMYFNNNNGFALITAAIPPNGVCAFSMKLVGNQPGTWKVSAGPVYSVEDAPSSVSSATLTVTPVNGVHKLFLPLINR
jgi:hypothetical protein